MKKIYLFIFATELLQSTATTISIGVIRSTTSGLLVTICDVTSLTGYITKNGTASSINLTASGGNNDMTANGDGFYALELTAGNTDTLGVFEIHLTKIDYAIDGRVFNVVEQDYWNKRASTADRIASATAAIAAADAKIDSVSAMVRAGSSLIPYSGGIIGRPAVLKTGDPASWYLSIPVLSRSGTDPGLKITMIEGDPSYALYKTQANFTKIMVSAASGIGDVTPVLHNYLLSTAGMPFKQFPFECHILNDGEIAGLAGVFVNDTTPEFVDSPENLAHQAYIEEFMRDISSGAIPEATAYTAVTTFTRDTPNTSNTLNTYVPAGQQAVIVVTITDPDGDPYTFFLLMDYDESTYDPVTLKANLSRKFPMSGYSTLSDWMVARDIASASLTVAGGP